MFTTLLNLQLDAFSGTLRPREFRLVHPHSPKELECLGFRLGEIGLQFQKGYMEVTGGFSKVNLPRSYRICEQFFQQAYLGLP